MEHRDWTWNMGGTYRVYSIDRAQWVDVVFMDKCALIKSNGVIIDEDSKSGRTTNVSCGADDRTSKPRD